MTDTYSHYSHTVEYYQRYRPGYPEHLIEWLRRECGLTPHHSIADIGAGTGQMTELFLAHGNPVYAVEPNIDMRLAAEQRFSGQLAFTSVAATAEASTLADQSIDMITVGNAFHWFNHDAARREFLRILAPNGWVILTWNLERNNGSAFMCAFEQFWQSSIDPAAQFTPFRARSQPAYLSRFFGVGQFKTHCLDNYQRCDFPALLGVTLSMLKTPKPGDRRYPAMVEALTAIFNQYQEDGAVTLEYDTAIIYGQLIEDRR